MNTVHHPTQSKRQSAAQGVLARKRKKRSPAHLYTSSPTAHVTPTLKQLSQQQSQSTRILVHKNLVFQRHQIQEHPWCMGWSSIRNSYWCILNRTRHCQQQLISCSTDEQLTEVAARDQICPAGCKMLSFGHNTGWQLDQCCRMDQLLSSGQAGSTQTHGSAAQLAKSFGALLATTQVDSLAAAHRSAKSELSCH